MNPDSIIGQTLAHYKIMDKLAEGGMGVVYRALDTHLDRPAAIKILKPEAVGSAERKRRFVLEAKAASALNHPGIVTIYDIDRADDVDFIAMEYLEGLSLDRLIPQGGIPPDQGLRYALEMTEAVAAAHAAGIVHRDIKPPNLMVSQAGHVKVLDFGLAKLSERTVTGEAAATITAGAETRRGEILGTVAYMSPEQAEGGLVDARSDVFSLGVVLYEVFCGRRPFRGESKLSILASILRETPEPLRKHRQDIPEDLERIILRCLSKKPNDRYHTASELHRELVACHARLGTWRAKLRRPALAAAVLAMLIVTATLGWMWYVRGRRGRWAEREALPEAARLINKQRPLAALLLLREAERYAPTSPEILRLKDALRASPATIQTIPAGADIYVRDYADTTEGSGSSHWQFVGPSPVKTDRIPTGYFRIRVLKDGFEAVESTFGAIGVLQIQLHSSQETPPGMIWVPSTGRAQIGSMAFPSRPVVEFPDYWLDKYEVTNRQFKEFVDAGGYQKREYWQEPFLKDGQTRSWEQAMAEFHDATGRPGPSTWELGTYPEGKADLPVGGVSWYEASAYARFAGKSLPTAYHWYRAAGAGSYSQIISFSNFAGKGPARVGSYQGLGPYGTYDMAGNVKEWCSSPAGDRRYILGGGWNEPGYLFSLPDARRPFDRAPTFGFRCAKYISRVPEALAGPVPFVSRDRRGDKPADGSAFRIYSSLHSYDKTDLKPRVESVDESSPHWHREEVTLQAAYGNERVLLHLYLPKNAAPPYQVVAYFPGASAMAVRTIEAMGTSAFDFIVRSGRAVALPAYKGTLERGPSEYYHQLGQPNLWREMNLEWSKDLGRTIDYLATRPEIDSRELGFYGFSLGGAMAPRLVAVEPRFKVAVLISAGSWERVPAEVDPWNFAARVKIPVLMLNGRDDFRFPLETSQRPLFHLLGTPDKDKRHLLYDGGHDIVTRLDVIKEALSWLDRYLGPVKARQ